MSRTGTSLLSQAALRKAFAKGIAWNTLGSATYEAVKLGHQIALLGSIAVTEYGAIGTFFSTIFLAVHLSMLGAEHAISPFMHYFTQSRKNFTSLMGFYLQGLIPFLIAGASLACYFLSKSIAYHNDTTMLVISFFIIVLEGTRIFLRAFLHHAFYNKEIITAELALMVLYITSIWIPYCFGVAITLRGIFIPYLITSLLAHGFFTALLWHMAQKITVGKKTITTTIKKRIASSRFFNYSIHVTKHLFTGNFLVILFATRFGLADAGIFKFASYFADALKGVVHVAIGFSAGALFAQLKTETLAKKKEAFYILSKKLNVFIYSILLFLVCNYYHFFALTRQTHQTLTVALYLAFFLLVTFLGHFFVVYDEFFILEEKTPLLFTFKLLEGALFYSVIMSGSRLSLSSTLLSIITIKLLSFVILAQSAYTMWNIRPHFTVEYKSLLLGCSAALGTSALLWLLSQ